jgi:hypothetical protein
LVPSLRMRTLSLALSAGLAWVGAAPEASKIAIVPVVVEGDGEPALASALVEALVKGTSDDGTTVVRIEQPCSDAGCLASVARRASATHVIAASVHAEGNDYRVELVAHDATGAARHSFKFDCEICTHADLRARLQREAAAFRSQLDASVPSPDGHPAMISVITTPAGAGVFIDGEQVGKTPYHGEVGPGRHSLKVEAKGYVAEDSEFEARSGGQDSFKFTLDREGQRASKRPGRLAIAGYASLGVGVGTLVAGSVLLAIDSRPIRSRCSGESMDINGACEYLHNTLAVGAVLTSVGAAAIITGIALAVVGRPGRKSKARAEVTFGGFKF